LPNARAARYAAQFGSNLSAALDALTRQWPASTNLSAGRPRLDDLAVPGLVTEPQQIRAAATLVGQRAWIRVAPGGRHAGEPIGGLDVIRRWTSVAHDDVELAVLREALAVNIHS
jgi:hypothetical protein